MDAALSLHRGLIMSRSIKDRAEASEYFDIQNSCQKKHGEAMIKQFSLFFFTEFKRKLRLLGESFHNYRSQPWQVSDEFRCTEILLLFRILLLYTNTKYNDTYPVFILANQNDPLHVAGKSISDDCSQRMIL